MTFAILLILALGILLAWVAYRRVRDAPPLEPARPTGPTEPVGADELEAERRAESGASRRDGFVDAVLGTDERLQRNESSISALSQYQRGVVAGGRLSEQERLVLACRARGLIPAAIADQLRLSDRRVHAILQKLKDVGALE